MSGRSLSLQSRPSRRRGFNPRNIAAVASGYWWDPAKVVGSGASIVLPEASGKSAFDLVTPAANTAPTLAFINGNPVLTFTDAAPDSLLRTATTKQRGFTGSCMIWGWVSNAAGVGSVLNHWRTANNLQVQVNGSDCRLNASDGGAAVGARFPIPPGGYAAGPFYFEAVIDLSVADATDRLQMFYNRVKQVPTLAATFGTAVLDSAEYINMCGASADSNNSNILATVSVGAWGITNGIPSTAERDALYNWRRLHA